MTRIFLTGAHGFLGTHVRSALAHRGVEFAAASRTGADGFINCDLLDRQAVRREIDAFRPDVIIHAAAQVPKSAAGYNDQIAADANLAMMSNLLAASAAAVVFVSSMTVYGEQDSFIRRECDAGQPQTLYGETKYRIELQLIADGRPGYAIRIPGLFGEERRSGLVYNLVAAACQKQQAVLPSASLLWAAMHVHDAAQSIAALACSAVKGFEPINIGYKGPCSVNCLVETVNDIFGSNFETGIAHPQFEFDLSRASALGAAPVGDLRKALIRIGESL